MRLFFRLLALAIMTLGLISTAPVEAQRGRGQRRGHQRPPAVQVTSYSPQQGGPGTRVTLRGAGFTPQTSVRLGGRNAQVEAVRPDALTFVVSARDRGGPIVVRFPGNPDIQVGSFTLARDPSITSVTTGRHRVGARLQISGSDFQRGDQVEIGGVALRVLSVTPRRITATLTPGVSTGRLSLVRQGRRYDSNVVVQVQAPAPELQAIQPTSGVPGTRVRLSVAHLNPSVRAHYGRTPLPTVRTGPSWIEVEIPANARSSNTITLHHSEGASSGQRFELLQPLTIRAIAATPARGGGVQLTIDGSGFQRGAQVSVGNVVGRTMSVSGNRIVAVVPGHAPIAAPVVVQQSGQSASSPRPLSAYRR